MPAIQMPGWPLTDTGSAVVPGPSVFWMNTDCCWPRNSVISIRTPPGLV